MIGELLVVLAAQAARSPVDRAYATYAACLETRAAAMDDGSRVFAALFEAAERACPLSRRLLFDAYRQQNLDYARQRQFNPDEVAEGYLRSARPGLMRRVSAALETARPTNRP
ncbi:MAG TPA: hypothetical protein VMG08_20250 [Allosphingosinicella sp.]|nr:hypothetical protein [Allosphingosinicella sp.]